MDPKDLAALHEKNKQDIAAAAEARKTKDQERLQQIEDVGARFADRVTRIILPYLAQVKEAIGKDFSFDAGYEAGTTKPVSLKFSMKDAGEIRIVTRGSSIGCTGVNSMSISINCPPARDVNAVEDLTTEKIGVLVKFLVDEHRRHHLQNWR